MFVSRLISFLILIANQSEYVIYRAKMERLCNLLVLFRPWKSMLDGNLTALSAWPPPFDNIQVLETSFEGPDAGVWEF